uniref:Large ribosomal subunit protein bL21m n=1 Tax=Denticeps clupeoides TaxID=299321 RepID=A0AAY4BVR0_9TELE
TFVSRLIVSLGKHFLTLHNTTTCFRPTAVVKMAVTLRSAVTWRISSRLLYSYVPETSLSRPPWPEVSVLDPEEQYRRHQAVVKTVNGLLGTGDYGRLFAVVHFASRQWKVTNEDLILIENHIDAECGDRIRMEKVSVKSVPDNTAAAFVRPLADGRDLVRVEATVIEKTESWPMVHMRFWKRHRYQRKKIIVQPQTVLRINSIQVAPRLS